MRREDSTVNLFDECSVDTVCLKQLKDVACRCGCQCPLARDHVMLGTISGSNVIFGDDPAEAGVYGDAGNFLGLTLSDKQELDFFVVGVWVGSFHDFLVWF
ncbi:MAG: hypothetical protein RL150_115 [Candidatus Parcubacteria bacterium]